MKLDTIPHKSYVYSGVCACRFTVKGKRIRCKLHSKEHTHPKRPSYYAMSPDAILKLGNDIEDPLGRAMIFLVYVTGARVGEVADFAPMRLQTMPDRYLIRLKTLKQRTGDASRRIPIPRGDYARCNENEMMEDVLKYIEDSPSHGRPFRKWGNMSEYIARSSRLKVEARKRTIGGDYTDVTIDKRLHPHYLRHARATHLVDFYGFNDMQLCSFFGWKNPEMAITYSKSQDLWKTFSATH